MEPAFSLSTVTGVAELNAPQLKVLLAHWSGPLMQAGTACDLPLTASVRSSALGPAEPHHWWFAVAGADDFNGLSFGAETTRIYQVDFTGQRLMQFARMPFVGRALRVLRATMMEGRPCRFFSETSLLQDWDFYDIEVLALPLAGPDGAVDSILGATVVRFK